MEEQDKTTDKSHLKGFGTLKNREHINRGGRPKGSRNKASLKRARELMDTDSLEAAQILAAIMRNDKDFLDTNTDVKMELRAKVAKDIIDKSIASQKDNDHLKSEEEKLKVSSQEEIEEDSDPEFSQDAVEPPIQ